MKYHKLSLILYQLLLKIECHTFYHINNESSSKDYNRIRQYIFILNPLRLLISFKTRFI